MIYALNETQLQRLEKWVNSRKIKSALRKGAKLSLTFDQGSGIGIAVEAELDKGVHADDMVIYPPARLDLTDYESW